MQLVDSRTLVDCSRQRCSDFGEINGYRRCSDFGEINDYRRRSDFGEINDYRRRSDFGEINDYGAVISEKSTTVAQ